MGLRPLPPALAEKAQKELNEDPNRVQADLQHIKDWIAKQPHLRARTDDQWLVAFLRGCKYSLERTKEKLDLYYSIQTTAPELFGVPYNSRRFEEILDLGAYVLLPKLPGPDGQRVAIVRPANYDPNKYSIIDVVAVSNVIQKIVFMEDDNAIVAGTTSILDLDAVTMSHFVQMTPVTMKKMVVASQDASPFRMKGIHYLNTPTGFETVFNAMKGLLNEKNKSRLYVHNKNYEEMYKHIPREILPAEYGGNGGTMKEITEYWKKKVKEYGPWLEEDMKFGSDEAKRIGSPKTAESMFGVEGSFRQLQVD